MRITFFKNTLINILPVAFLVCFSCGSQNNDPKDSSKAASIPKEIKQVFPGIYDSETYLPLLMDKKVGVVANPTSAFSETQPGIHLVDYLLLQEVDVQKVFSPEHGFRGKADAGENVKDGRDPKSGIPIFSLHGKHRKPTKEHMQGLEIMVFDIQDVGVRFYTYLSTLHYVMEACAENNIPIIVLDRPNPNGHYIDGPMMEPEHTGFLGLHPVPLVYGMTIGEYAKMINGEGWLNHGMKAELTVIPIQNYSHESVYSLPIKPSPNLPNDKAINLYPSLGLLEGTTVNAGRGTQMQFQLIGSPNLPQDKYPFRYTPMPNEGAKHPKFEGEECNGLDLRNTPRMDRIDLTWIIDAYRHYSDQDLFFNTKNFTAHAGTEVLQQQIEKGMSFETIRKTWKEDLLQFKKLRSKYLIYD